MKIYGAKAIQLALDAMNNSTPVELFGELFLIEQIDVTAFPKLPCENYADVSLIQGVGLKISLNEWEKHIHKPNGPIHFSGTNTESL